MSEVPVKVLVFVGTEGIYHDHEGQGRFLVGLLNKDPQIQAYFSQDYAIMTAGLGGYDATLFFTDVGNFSQEQGQGLLEFIEGGGGFFGLHTADASFQDNAGYHQMLNGFFDGHSPYMDFKVEITDAADPIVAGLQDFEVRDELHYLKHDASRSHPIMEAYDPGRDEKHVMAYRHAYGQGRVFFFALGHDQAVLDNASFQEVVRRGALWVGKRL
jgi:type 1 glutamine amidotransferase